MHLWYLAAAIAAAASVFLNPAFTTMRKISENNGYLPLRHISSTDELILLCLLVLALLIGVRYYLLEQKQRQLRLCCSQVSRIVRRVDSLAMSAPDNSA